MAERPLRISFDLDDCLICYDPLVPCEPNRVPFPLRRWFREPLRQGTRALLHELHARGCDVWVYTTSYRSPRYLRWWLGFHGVRLGGVVNQEVHDRTIGRAAFGRCPSKYPKVFGIDLHVDDSEGVAMEGRAHGFDVLVVRPDDERWADRVRAAVDEKLAKSP